MRLKMKRRCAGHAPAQTTNQNALAENVYMSSVSDMSVPCKGIFQYTGETSNGRASSTSAN
jgi:hypothetical protein